MYNLTNLNYSDATHCIHRTDVPISTATGTKSAHTGVYLRSYKLPQPKAPSAARVAQVLGELGISHTRLVMPTCDNCVQLENLLDTATALVETKKVVDKVEQDIRIMKARLGEQEPGGEDGAETGDAAPTPMDVDDGNDVEGDPDGHGRAQSVVSTRSTRSRRQVSLAPFVVSSTGSLCVQYLVSPIDVDIFSGYVRGLEAAKTRLRAGR